MSRRAIRTTRSTAARTTTPGCVTNAKRELIPRIHFERDIREGIDDYRYMLTLSRLLKREAEPPRRPGGPQAPRREARLPSSSASATTTRNGPSSSTGDYRLQTRGSHRAPEPVRGNRTRPTQALEPRRDRLFSFKARAERARQRGDGAAPAAPGWGREPGAAMPCRWRGRRARAYTLDASPCPSRQSRPG